MAWQCGPESPEPEGRYNCCPRVTITPPLLSLISLSPFFTFSALKGFSGVEALEALITPDPAASLVLADANGIGPNPEDQRRAPVSR